MNSQGVPPGLLGGPVGPRDLTGEMRALQVPGSSAMVIGGGLPGGIGVTFGSGCTSGTGSSGSRGDVRRRLGTAGILIARYLQSQGTVARRAPT